MHLGRQEKRGEMCMKRQVEDDERGPRPPGVWKLRLLPTHPHAWIVGVLG